MSLCLIKIICFLAAFHCNNCLLANTTLLMESNLIIKGLQELISNLKDSRIFTVNFINGNEFAWHGVFQDILRDSVGFPVQIESYEKALKPHQRKRFFTIIFAGNIRSLENFCNEIAHEIFHFNGYFVIITSNQSLAMDHIFEIFWKKFIFNVNVLVTTESSPKASLFTFIPFQETFCDDISAVKINEFDGETKKWTTDAFFPKKLRNLQKCAIKVGTYRNLPGTMIKLANGTKMYYGLEDDILSELATQLNFSVDIKIYPIDSGVFHKNKTATGLMKRVLEQEVNLIYGTLSLQSSRTEFLSATNPNYFDRIVLVIPPALLIDPVKKLLLPFEFLTWMGILLMLSIACFITTAIKFLPSGFHNLIIGRNIKNEYLRIWGLLLGVSLEKLPNRNFARFVLMLFTMFSLVMRASYMGSLFNILKNDISSNEINSISELDRMGFTFFIYESLAVRLKDDASFKR